MSSHPTSSGHVVRADQVFSAVNNAGPAPTSARTVLRLLDGLKHGVLDMRLPDGSKRRYGQGGPLAVQRGRASGTAREAACMEHHTQRAIAQRTSRVVSLPLAVGSANKQRARNTSAMSTRAILFALLFAPAFALAQQPASKPPNALTMQLIMAQRPAHIPAEEWQAMMLKPVNYSLYPIRVTQAMLDTIDATQLDRRYQYIMVKEFPVRGVEVPAIK